MRLSTSHSRLLPAAFALMAIGIALHAAHAVFGLGGHAVDSLIENWVYTAVELIAVAVCAARALSKPADRAAWTLVSLGLLAWSGGDLVWTVWLNNLSDPPFPSVADALYLAWYPAVYVAMLLLIRSRHRQVGAAQWLDGGVVGLTVAAIGAALIFPTVLGASSGRLVEDAVNLAYPLADFALLVFVAVAFALSGWRPGRMWLCLGVGISLSAAADIVFVYQAAKGTYVAGTLLDTLWPAAMSLFAVAAWQPVKRRAALSLEAPQTIILTLVCALAAWGLLIFAALSHVAPVAVGLAGAALLLATARATLTYRENVRVLRDSAHHAVTDALSGLGNRRRLMDDLASAVTDAGHGHASTLVFFDLNGFKRYNDSFGHAAGDSLLARMGAALGTAVNAHGEAYRLGGDEFCVLLHGRIPRHDRLVASAAAALTERGSAFTVGASFGLATIPDDAASASAALQLADQRMYSDKARSSRGGRAKTRDVLMQLLNERTPEIHDHVSGVGQLAADLAREFGLDSDQRDETLRAAELHDIGKLAIPDEILEKPGPLNESEWQFMRQHPVVGERILNADPALRPVARLVRASHERWDGTGYPDGLAGAAIPLGARIIAACDAYQAMTSERCYQRARSSDDAIAELQRNAGSQFDPEVIQAFCHRLSLEPGRPLAPSPSNDPARVLSG
ncbi:MAG TPA: diguanylate cyclase [Solirubrobacteraceae bacterium]|nr:diguanylate cyclase [Solirubrobacteraceae bacterium]